MRSAFALRIFSGKMIFKFGTAERLRALRCPVFTGRSLYSKRQLPRLLPLEAAARGKSFLKGRGLSMVAKLPA